MAFIVADEFIAEQNRSGLAVLEEDYAHLARHRAGGAIDPVAVYRESGYRQKKAEERPAEGGSGSGIV